MTVVVLGGAGFIGRQICWSLFDQGQDYAVIDDMSLGYPDLLPPSTRIYELSTHDTSRMRQALVECRARTIIHLAADKDNAASIVNPIRYYSNNVAGTISLIRALDGTQVDNIVFSSSASVYGEVDPGILVSEDHQIAPLSPYGASKAMCERILGDFAAASAVRVVCLRYFNVAGADPLARTGDITAEGPSLPAQAMLAALNPDRTMVINGDCYATEDGTPARDFIHVADLAELHLLAISMRHEGPKSLILNCGYGKGVTVGRYLATLQEVSGRQIQIRIGAPRPGDVGSVVSDPSRIIGLLGWQPKFGSLEDIVQHEWSWAEKKDQGIFYESLACS